MHYNPRQVVLDTSPGHEGPATVTALLRESMDKWQQLLETGVGYIPTFPAVATGLNPQPGNGNLAGCTVYQRSNVDSATRHKQTVWVATDVVSVLYAHEAAWRNNQAEREFIRESLVGNRRAHRLLADWLHLDDVVKARVDELQSDIADGLPRQPIDQDKVKLAERTRVRSDAAVDSRGIDNPAARRAALLADRKPMQRREAKVRMATPAIDRRSRDITALMVDHMEAYAAHQAFFARTKRLSDDLDYFITTLYPTGRLDNLSRLDSWVVGEVQAGRADDPLLVRQARDALEFWSYQEEWLRLIRPFVSMSLTKATENAERYQREFAEPLRRLRDRLKDWPAMVGPIANERRQLARLARELLRAVEVGDWPVVILRAERFKYIYFHGIDDEFWYTHAPEGVFPWTLAEQTRPCYTGPVPEDAFEGLPM